jgi:hypothetical protein
LEELNKNFRYLKYIAVGIQTINNNIAILNDNIRAMNKNVSNKMKKNG